ncbi:hypothetical protein O181_063332 [Austropuccinia psidii MF-1]|uniref:Retroviral polymerase SH3-like domain-containing protein n=1 Tax=Austropuccinia psidii MF-1 TaxID=1389203 RepID=A0A9Q3I195_9BASI|nr:hypothetical protein [Austropuccinia psidii MF-1]
MLGYENHASAYRILRLQDKQVVISRHVKSDETYFPNLLPPLNPTKLHKPISPISPNLLILQTESVRNVTDKNDSCSKWEGEFHNAMEEIPQRRIRVIGPRHPTLITGDISEENILPYQRRAHQTVESNTIPNNYQQAIKSKDSDKWEEEILKELDNRKKLKAVQLETECPRTIQSPALGYSRSRKTMKNE